MTDHKSDLDIIFAVAKAGHDETYGSCRAIGMTSGLTSAEAIVRASGPASERSPEAGPGPSWQAVQRRAGLSGEEALAVENRNRVLRSGGRSTTGRSG
jgi:hypothetical protein